ncbi:MAG TPA: LLM class F420-dependent oxidoreductase [Thermomicrobiales bacterium]|jgi:probable F420-dependent oxidoreductase
MRIGATFPQTEIGNDPVAIRDWAQAAEGVGYDHILVFDHVLGAGLSTRPNWSGPYNSATPFHEVFVLYGYIAALTSRVELVTGVVILPQRQTALVAKQAATLDLLSGGRLRLGVGVGWNAVEYEGLNENFSDRGARSEEQIAVMRALWQETAIDFKGRWHTLDNAGINPLPVQRPIPIWIGGTAEPVLERIGRIGDGWFPQRPADDEMKAALERLHGYAEKAGRAPSAIGIEPRIGLGQVREADAADYLERWRALGATHISVNFMGAGFKTPQEHIEALRRVRELLPHE